MVALWEAFYIENKRFDLDSLRVPSRSPTPISKYNDFRGQSDHIWGARGPHFRPILGIPTISGGPGAPISDHIWGVRAGLNKTSFLAL